MAKEGLSGKLAVILHADVAGSTALVQQDERLAHERIQSTFHRLGDTITKYHGHVRELRGDALLAEFERASDAVTAALAFQTEQVDSNQQLNDRIQPTVRVGIAMGEVIIADDTITGTGVVLAQRLEQISDPCGVVIQGAAYETIPGRFPFEYENLGEQTLKGFDQPIRAFTVSLKTGEELPSPEDHSESQSTGHNNLLFPAKLSRDSYEALTGERLELPDQPSIAVLPFQNMSGDPEQEYFAAGMSEDIITSLSRIPRLFVIARNSTFVYKGHAVDVRQIGQELGVSHVLEGSVRRVGNRIRITTQLVETQNGNHLWAERYDRKLDDIFAVQDEITRNIVTELSFNLTATYRGITTSTTNLEAWELTIKAGDLLDTGVKANVANAQQLLKRALELDSNYPAAQIELGWSYLEEFTVTWNLASEGSWQKAFDAAESAIELDPKNPGGYSLLGHLYMSRGEIDRALAMSTKSIELGPSDSYGQAFRGDVLIEAGRFDEGIAAVRNAIRLCPFPPAWFLLILGTGFHLKGENELALSALEQSIKREPGKFNSLLWLASVLIAMGREDDAKEIARSATSMEPEFSTREWASKISPKSRGLIKDNILAAGFPK